MATELYGKTSVCFTWRSTEVMRYVKLARHVKLSAYKHDRAQSGTMHSHSVYSASLGKTCAGNILPSFEHNWLSGHVQDCSAKKRSVGMPFPHQIKRKATPNSLNKDRICLQELLHWLPVSL